MSAPRNAKVVGGDAAARRRTAELLGDAGFAVEAPPPELVVVIASADHGAYASQVRAAAEAHPDAHILAVVPTTARNASLRRALLAGAAGIVLEADLDRALIATARALLTGQLAVPVSLGRQIAPRPLSHREKQVVGLVVGGSTNREIAHKLYLAESTVKTHLSSAFRKLDARSRSEAVARILDPEAGYGVGILAVAEGPAAGRPLLAARGSAANAGPPATASPGGRARRSARTSRPGSGTRAW
jgi:DNA-binding NarL/FixJ family response regulator